MYNKSLFIMKQLFNRERWQNFNTNKMKYKEMKKNEYNKMFIRKYHYSNNLPPPDDESWTFILIAAVSVYISHHLFKKK